MLHPNSTELFLLLRKSDVTHETCGGERHSEGECDVIEMVTLARGGFQEKILLVRARHLVVVFQLLRHQVEKSRRFFVVCWNFNDESNLVEKLFFLMLYKY